MKHSEVLLPFYIPPDTGDGLGGINAERLQIPNDHKGVLELRVISGGPVFLAKGGRTKQSMYSASHDGNADFDLAATEGHHHEIGVEPNVGQLTVHSDNESIGYIRLREC